MMGCGKKKPSKKKNPKKPPKKPTKPGKTMFAYHYHEQTTQIVSDTDTKGIATAIAIGQHSFDASTFAWQGSISTGSYDDSTAFSFGLAKRFRATLISGSVANEGGKLGYGASLGFKF
jgi:hypothetical protein